MAIKSKYIGQVYFDDDPTGESDVIVGTLQIPTFAPAQLMYINAAFNVYPSEKVSPSRSALLTLESPLITGDQEFLINDIERLQTIPYPFEMPGGTEITFKARSLDKASGTHESRLSIAVVYDQ